MKKPNRKWLLIEGRKYLYQCHCTGVHTIDCVTQKMWDAVSEQLYRKEKKRKND